MINKLKNEKGSITVYVLVAMLFLLAIVTARYLLANRQLKTQVAALGRIQNVYSQAYEGNGDGSDDGSIPGIKKEDPINDNTPIPIFNSDAFIYFRQHKDEDPSQVEPYYIYQTGKYYVGGKGKTYKLMFDIKVNENSNNLRTDFLNSIDYNNHIIYAANSVYFYSGMNWQSE